MRAELQLSPEPATPKQRQSQVSFQSQKSIVKYTQGIRGQIMWDCVTTGVTEDIPDSADELIDELNEEKKEKNN